jgi:hypothetical protein
MVVTACGGEAAPPADTAPPAHANDDRTGPTPGCADVVDVEVSEQSDGALRFDVTVHSDDTGWEQYADRWEVRSFDGTTLAVRELTHPHVEEQPFTRSLTGVELSPDTTTVEIVARDSVNGYCGETMEVELEG